MPAPRADEFNEADHPRDERGRFGDGGTVSPVIKAEETSTSLKSNSTTRKKITEYIKAASVADAASVKAETAKPGIRGGRQHSAAASAHGDAKDAAKKVLFHHQAQNGYDSKHSLTVQLKNAIEYHETKKAFHNAKYDEYTPRGPSWTSDAADQSDDALVPHVYRLDLGVLGKAESTPQGGLRIPAHLTRAGVFQYTQPDGKVIREYRPDSEVFAEDSLATLPDAPVTNNHPPSHLSPANYRKFTVGHVNQVRQDGNKIAAAVVIQDADALKSITTRGRRQISCGYHCDVDETPGVTPEGEVYDRVQRNIRYNHVAVVDIGRAGADVRLRLDTSDNAIAEETEMAQERIDGVDYEVGTPPHLAAIKRRDDDAETRQKVNTELQAKADREAARADAAETKLAAALEQVSPARLDELVRARADIRTRAATVLGKEFKADGLPDGEIKRAAVAKAYPGLKLDSKTEDYIGALFDSISYPRASGVGRADGLSDRPPIPGHLLTPPAGQTSDGSTGRTMAQVRADRANEDYNRHRRPNGAAKPEGR